VAFTLTFSQMYRFVDIDLSTGILLSEIGTTITYIVPPALPLMLSMSQNISLFRLRLKNILGADPQRIVNAGTVTCMCFDKTGTLTKLDVDVEGFNSLKLDSGLVKLEPLTKEVLFIIFLFLVV